MTALSSPAAERNKVPISEILKIYINSAANQKAGLKLRLLEIASGYGSHAIYFSALFPDVHWQPTEFDSSCLSSITAHLVRERDSGRPRNNVADPVKLDVSLPPEDWPQQVVQFCGKFDFVLNVNMVHISPWKCTLGLFSGAAAMLKIGGKLLMYGPFAIDGVLEPQSNIDFDHSLKLNNPEWGVRDIRDLEQEAAKQSFVLQATHDMPANNKILVWEKI